MKVIIAGGRNYKFDQEDIDYLDSMKEYITEVVSGVARGADTGGMEWAEWNNISVEEFPAKWINETGVLDKGAGFARNVEMAKYSDMLIAFEGGHGTAHMIKTAKEYDLIVEIRKH